MVLHALPQNDPENDKNQDGAKAAAAQLFGAIAGQQGSEDIYHVRVLGL